ncbi:ABC transporter permease [Streptomyces sp. NPDC005438]|uniref:ABC transporter permease n=1 Tax=Streptomyces sp. NPDC005438 TaxID=3156880 RepID=UPI0033B29D22
MFRTAVRNVLAHKARLLMTVLAVMLGVAFVAGTLVFTSSVSEALLKSSKKGYESVDLAIRPDSKGAAAGERSQEIGQEVVREVDGLSGTASVTGIASGFTGLSDKNGKSVGGGWGSKGANYGNGAGAGDSSGADKRYPLTDGRAPRAKGEVALDSKTAKRTKYQVGDTVPISVDGPVRKERVVGVFDTKDGSVAAGGSLVLFDPATAQRLFATPGHFTEIEVTARQGVSQAALKKQVEKVLPAGVTAKTGETLADEEAEAIRTQTKGIETSMLVFAGIALFVGIFIIANTFTMLVAQRTKELALLRAVGASRRQVTRSVLIEATMVGLAASVTGLAAGVGIGAGLRSLMGSFGDMPDGPLLVTSTTVLVSLVVGVVVTVLAAYLPARRAAKIPPVAAMSSVHAPATTRSLVVRNSIGSLFAAAGVALVFLGALGDGGEKTVGLGAAILMIGVFVLTPLLSRPLIAAAGPALRMFGVAGKLARQNAVRNPRRTAATASALTIGLTLITALTVVAGGVQKGIDKMATDSLKADYMVSMANYTPLSPQVEKTLRQQDDVVASSPLRTTSAKIDGDWESLNAVNSKTFPKLTSLDFNSGSWKDVSQGKRVVVDDSTAKEKGWKVGSTFTTTYRDGKSERYTVSGIYQGNEIMSGIMTDTRSLAGHVTRTSDIQVMVKTQDGANSATKDRLEKALGNSPSIQVQDKEDISESIAQFITIMLNVVYGLLAMAVIVAVLGVVNTLAMSVFERSQEIGMLRAVGLDRRGVKRTVRLESLVIALFGGVLGVGLGVFLGWAAGELVASSGLDTYQLVLPWGRLALFLALAALVGVVAALWPARRAAKVNMLTAIKSE